MPLYEYQCKQCDHRFEKIQSFSAPEIKECPACGGEVEKLISAPAIQFKGSGWYVSDYGKGGAPGSNTKPGKSDGGESSATSSESKSDSGPASNAASGSSSSSEGGGSGASTTPTASSAGKKD